MKKIFLTYGLILIIHLSYARRPLYRVFSIDSTELQYVITLVRISNSEVFTIYTYKYSTDEIDDYIIKKKLKKIVIQGMYRLKFEEHLIGQPEFRVDSKGNKVHLFYIDRLYGLYYDPTSVSIFRRRNYWKPRKNQ